MNRCKKLGWVSFIFLVFFLLVSLPQAKCADSTGNAPVMVASQEATIPLAANAVTGATDTDSPKLTLKMGALFLYRGNGDKNYMLAHGGAPFATHAEVDSNDLTPGWAPGTDDSIMLQNKEFGVELRYLGALGWSESKHDFASDYGEGRLVAGYAEGKDKSWLNNGELNFHWWPCANDRYNLLMGVRFLRLNERLTAGDYRVYEDGLTWGEEYQGSTVNQLWGGQVGAEGLLFGKRDQGFSVDGVVKAGMFHNGIHNKFSYDSSFGGTDFSWSRAKTTVLGEVGLNGNYAFTKNIAMTAGYEFMYLSAACVVPQGMDVLHERVGFNTQSVIFHGPRVGLNISF